MSLSFWRLRELCRTNIGKAHPGARRIREYGWISSAGKRNRGIDRRSHGALVKAHAEACNSRSNRNTLRGRAHRGRNHQQNQVRTNCADRKRGRREMSMLGKGCPHDGTFSPPLRTFDFDLELSPRLRRLQIRVSCCCSRPLSKRPGKLPAEYRRARCASCVFCLLSVSRAACACG